MSAEISRLTAENNALRKEIEQLRSDIAAVSLCYRQSQTNNLQLSKKIVDLEDTLEMSNKDLAEHTEFIYQKGYYKGLDDGRDATDGRY